MITLFLIYQFRKLMRKHRQRKLAYTLPAA